MKTPYPLLSRLSFILIIIAALSACDKLGLNQNQSNPQGNRPDLDCIIANDFYAVHFSVYIQPVQGEQTADPRSAFVPYCQKIPRSGKMFFTADLFDRDIRSTPIGIRIVEVEKTAAKAPDDYREIRTIADIPSKLYPRGAVEAQAEINKDGDYLLILLVGDAVAEDDRFRIPLEVGVDPNALSPQTISLALGMLLVIAGLIFIGYRYFFKSQAASHNKK
jgi:hypothetical protein